MIYSTYQDAQFEDNANELVSQTLRGEPYTNVQKLAIEVRYRQASMFGNGMFPTSSLFQQPHQVVVTVGVPPDQRYPRLAERIH